MDAVPVRRFEAGSSEQLITEELKRVGYTLSFIKNFRYRLSPPKGRPTVTIWRGVVKFVDDLRVQRGVERILKEGTTREDRRGYQISVKGARF